MRQRLSLAVSSPSSIQVRESGSVTRVQQELHTTGRDARLFVPSGRWEQVPIGMGHTSPPSGDCAGCFPSIFFSPSPHPPQAEAGTMAIPTPHTPLKGRGPQAQSASCKVCAHLCWSVLGQDGSCSHSFSPAALHPGRRLGPPEDLPRCIAA